MLLYKIGNVGGRVCLTNATLPHTTLALIMLKNFLPPTFGTLPPFAINLSYAAVGIVLSLQQDFLQAVLHVLHTFDHADPPPFPEIDSKKCFLLL